MRSSAILRSEMSEKMAMWLMISPASLRTRLMLNHLGLISPSLQRFHSSPRQRPTVTSSCHILS